MTAVPATLEALQKPEIDDIVADATRRYVATRRALIPAFVDRSFSWRGAWRLHGRAAGWDVVRAPANLLLAGPYLALRASAGVARRLGRPQSADWLGNRRLFFVSDVSRELEWRLFSELLELPYAQDKRRFERDALAEQIFADPRIDDALLPVLQEIGRRADDPQFRRWLTDAMDSFAGSRVAAGDMATAMISAGVGALAFKQLTPGMLSLGPMLAHAVTQHMAIASFPLGAGAGGLWYGAMPVAAPMAMTAAATGGLMAFAAVFAAFSGVVTDPVQRHLGLHHRRLNKLVDCLERELAGDGESRFAVHDHYVARVLDLLDIVRTAYGVIR